MGVLVGSMLGACGPMEDGDLTDDGEDLEEIEGQELALGALPSIELLPSVTPDGKAIALTLTNPAQKPVTCASVAFRTPIAVLDHCLEQPLSNEFLEFKGLHFAAQESKVWADSAAATHGAALGRERLAQLALDRKKQGFGDEILEYCAMGGSERFFDCGYDCTSVNHFYGDEWTTNLPNGGTKKYRCLADGTAPDTETKCAGGLVPGQQQRVPGGEGTTLVGVCQADGAILWTAECSGGYQQTPDRQSCVPASCGVVPHGGEYFLYNVDNGKVVTTCRYGQPDPNGNRAVCNAEFVPAGLACVPRPMRDCGPGRPHGWSQTFFECGTGGEYRVRKWCDDGRIRETSTKIGRICR